MVDKWYFFLLSFLTETTGMVLGDVEVDAEALLVFAVVGGCNKDNGNSTCAVLTMGFNNYICKRKDVQFLMPMSSSIRPS